MALAGEFRVRAFALVDPDPDRRYAGEAPPGVELESVPQTPRGRRRAAALAGSLVGGGAYSARLYRSALLERRLAVAAREERPAWVLAHSYHVAPAALSTGAPVWIDFHNLDSEIWKRVAETAGSPARRAFARLQAPRVARLESELAAAASGISCVSERDAGAIRALGARAVPIVAPNGVDLERYAMRAAQPEGEVVFFVGDLSWPPNAEAVRWLRDRVWPELVRRRPKARAEILGRGAPPDLAPHASGNGFVLLGEGGDTRPHWARASVAVVPLLAGGGTRLKILEAAASGVPVVATPVGAEGLELETETRRSSCAPMRPDSRRRSRRCSPIAPRPGVRRRPPAPVSPRATAGRRSAASSRGRSRRGAAHDWVAAGSRA